MKVTLIVAHEYDSKRKVGFHYWADYLVANGHKVDYVSVGKSYLFKLFGRPLPNSINQWINISDAFNVYNWVSWVHPFLKHRLLNPLLTPIFRLIPFQFGRQNYQRLANSDLIIVESGIGLALVPFIRNLSSHPKIIYEVSDRLSTVGAHPYVLEAENNAKTLVDLIRVPAKVMLDDFKDISNIPVEFIPQGISKAAFDQSNLPNPYNGARNTISIGDMLFDDVTISDLANAFPNWQFHLFGRGAKLKTKLPNVVEYGECRFDDIVPYIKFADIALAPYKKAQNCEYLSQSSLKILQYTYCNLPIVAPNFAASASESFFSYDDKNSAVKAFSDAIEYKGDGLSSQVLSWDEMLDIELRLLNINVR